MDCRKILIAAISCLAIALLGNGCTGKKVKKTDEVITLRWVSDPNPNRKDQIALFEKAYPEIKVTLDWASAGLEKILVQMAGGNAPDLIDIYSPTVLNIFAEKEVMLDITSYCKKYEVDLEDFWPQCKSSMCHQDKVYAFPTNAADFVLFYNKKLFDEAGVNYPDETWTLENILEAGRKLTKVDPATRRHKQFGLLWEGWLSDILIWQMGGSKYGPDGRKCSINSPEAKESLGFLYDLIFKYHVMPTQSQIQSLASEGGWGLSGQNLFGAESIAMFPSGRWAIIDLRKVKDLDWDIAPLPKGKKKTTFFITRTTAISRTCKYPEDAFKFLLFLRSKEYNELISRSGDSLPACMSIAKSDIFLYDPAHPKETKNKLYLEQMEYARNKETSPYASDLEVGKIEQYEYDLMWNKTQTPEETLENIANRINALIQKGIKESS